MRKSGLPVPVAVLLSGVLAAGAAAQETGRELAKLPPSAGNPLWAIPLGELSQTSARPLFSPTRRPPPSQLAAMASSPARPTPPSRPAPDHPLLMLLGTIVSETVEIGVFVDEASHDVIRLKAGEAHDGWTLSSVVGRTAIFQKDGFAAATLMLPAPDTERKAQWAPPVIQPIAIQGPTFEPGVNPATTKGGARRPPREG